MGQCRSTSLLHFYADVELKPCACKYSHIRRLVRLIRSSFKRASMLAWNIMHAGVHYMAFAQSEIPSAGHLSQWCGCNQLLLASVLCFDYLFLWLHCTSQISRSYSCVWVCQIDRFQHQVWSSRRAWNHTGLSQAFNPTPDIGVKKSQNRYIDIYHDDSWYLWVVTVFRNDHQIIIKIFTHKKSPCLYTFDPSVPQECRFRFSGRCRKSGRCRLSPGVTELAEHWRLKTCIYIYKYCTLEEHRLIMIWLFELMYCKLMQIYVNCWLMCIVYCIFIITYITLYSCNILSTTANTLFFETHVRHIYNNDVLNDVLNEHTWLKFDSYWQSIGCATSPGPPSPVGS